MLLYLMCILESRSCRVKPAPKTRETKMNSISSISAVFSHLLSSSSSTDHQPHTPSSIFIQNYTIALQLLQGDSSLQTNTDFSQQRCWEEVRKILEKELRVRSNSTYLLSEWAERKDLKRVMCLDIIHDGFVTVKGQVLDKVNEQLAELVQMLFNCSLENLARKNTTPSSTSLSSSSSKEYTPSRESTEEEREDSGVERHKSESCESEESVDEYEQEVSGSEEFSIESSARSSLLSSIAVLDFSDDAN
jgi:hypothetical protein